ncbi:MAG: endonuclease [Bacilli bacterium]|nr:endonuclease [Bacilli bacterium]
MKKFALPLILPLLASCACGPTASSSEASISSSEAAASVFVSESSLESSKDDSSIQEGSSSIQSLDPYTLYGGYYASLGDWENGGDLIEKLYSIIHGGTYTPITYAGTYTNWASNQEADEYLYDHEYVDVVYSLDNVLKTGTNTYWQREHAFCASLMTGSTTTAAVKCLGRATDFHNLFASNSSANSSRGNKNYGFADTSSVEYVSRFSNGKEDGYGFDLINFEPGNRDKGRLSRAIFYMATMYSKDEYDSVNKVNMKGLRVVEENVDYVAGDSCAFAIGNLSTLLSWSEYEVDLAEYRHNESVYSYVPPIHSDPANNVAQGNRNPYVDFPGLVDYAFGSKKGGKGSLKDVISSYETLDIGKEGVSYYAIESAKRQYDNGEPFHLSDLNVVAVNHDLSQNAYTEFTVVGAKEGEAIESEGQTVLTVNTPINNIPYTVLVETDPIQSADWKHLVTAKSSGNDFYGISSAPGVIHTLNFDGVNWDVTYASGSVQSNSAALGCKFGTTDVPVGTIIFTSSEAFSYGGKNNVMGVYLSGAAASGKSYSVSISVGDILIGNFTLGYVKAAVAIGSMLDAPVTGRVYISITNITSACYVQYLAVHLD